MNKSAGSGAVVENLLKYFKGTSKKISLKHLTNKGSFICLLL